MTDTRIKICGLTSESDAQLAAQLGADYLGMIFARSPRRVDTKTARSIRAVVPDAMLVGVFADAPIDEIVEAVSRCELNMLQLHGNETPEYCEQLLCQTNIPLIKSFTAGSLPDTRRLSSYKTTSFFLFDLDRNAPKEEDHPKVMAKMWEEVSDKRNQGFRVFLAGGLNNSNVVAAITKTRPFCVDVCRGVEREPGVKDADKMMKFISEVRS